MISHSIASVVEGIPKHTVPMLVGSVGMRLNNPYDPNQMWFPFMTGTLWFAHATSEDTPDAAPVERKKKRPKPAKTYAFCPPEARRLFVYAKDVDQYTLPFFEGRKVTNTDYTVLEAAGFPGWGRNEAGGLHIVKHEMRRTEELREWCQLNCKFRFSVKPAFSVFQHANDAVLAKLMFS